MLTESFSVDNRFGSKLLPFICVECFQKGVQENKRELTKMVSLIRKWKKIYHEYLFALFLAICIHPEVG